MIDLSLGLIQLGYRPYEQFEVEDHGEGPVLASWSHPADPQPALADIEAAVSGAAQASKRKAVDAEHDRRIAAGRSFAITGVGDVPLEGSERTQVVLLALKDSARDLKAAGVTATVLTFTDRDNNDRQFTPDQMIELVNAGKVWMQAMHEAKRQLKTMAEIPDDFADDSRWP